MSKSLISEIEDLLDSGSSTDFYSKVSDLFMKQNRLVLKSVEDLLSKHFVVEDYQRGYKWTKEQVQQLLDDIAEYNPSDDGFYCLQPVVVKRLKQDDKLKWELIDGQQRLTTIFLILQYLEHESSYEIDYRTRKSSGEFLKKDKLKDVAKNENWQAFLDAYHDKDYNNLYWSSNFGHIPFIIFILNRTHVTIACMKPF